MTLYPQQQQALAAIKAFLTDRNKQVFILRGYAGTGKTTMISALLPLAKEYGRNKTMLMAPTGRAAKVLQEKTGMACSTIHKAIYRIQKVNTARDEEGEDLETLVLSNESALPDYKVIDRYDLYFEIYNKPDYQPQYSLIIVDESSMIKSVKENSERLHFGTDCLLDDLLTFAQLENGAKILFVGDPAQLPPVGDNKSAALEDAYFQGKGINVSAFELTDVIRQGKDSPILTNAMMVRDLLQSEHRNELNFIRTKGIVEDMLPNEMVAGMYQKQPVPEIGNAIIIAYSNARVKEYNDAIRKLYYPDIQEAEGKIELQVGDVLQVVKNAYIRPKENSDITLTFMNGEFLKVKNVLGKTVLTAPVWVKENGEKKQVKISVAFREVELELPERESIRWNIVETLLNSKQRDLTYAEVVSIYINFKMRTAHLPTDSEEYMNAVETDPYLNAMWVKYGYAITGHKSQGGEWNTALVDYTGGTGFSDDHLRWVYTATTRAKETLCGYNMPAITPLTNLKFNGIMSAKKPEAEAYSFADADTAGTCLPANATPAQKSQFLALKQNLSENGYTISKVVFYPWEDRYLIDGPNGVSIIKCIYGKSGKYTTITPISLPDNDTKVLTLIRETRNIKFAVDYVPSLASLRQLYTLAMSACDDYGITITNIVEDLKQYKVIYYFLTSGNYSKILFYVNKEMSLTQAFPSSDLGEGDELMKKLIERLQNER